MKFLSSSAAILMFMAFGAGFLVAAGAYESEFVHDPIRQPNSIAVLVDGKPLHIWQRVDTFNCGTGDTGSRSYYFTAGKDTSGGERLVHFSVVDYDGQTKIGTLDEFKPIPHIEKP